MLEKWTESLRTGAPFDMVFPLRGKDGVLRPFLTRVMPLRDGNGQVIRWFGTNTDLSENRQIEDQLRAQEERLRLATNAAHLGIWVWYVADDFVTWENDRLYEIFGVPRSDEPINTERFLAEFVHQDDAEQFTHALANALQTGGEFFFLGRFRRGDGVLRWCEFTGLVQHAEDGSVNCIVGTAADVTERQLAEAELRKSEEQRRLALDSAEMGSWHVDPATFQLVTDERFREIFGVEAKQLEYEQAVALIHPDDQASFEPQSPRRHA